LAKKIMRTGHFCLTTEHDCVDFVRKSIKCQMHASLTYRPFNSLELD
jgi:hypothetical protein